MNRNEYIVFIEELLKELLVLIMDHSVSIKDLKRDIHFHGWNFCNQNYTSIYNSPSRCLAYALRYGIKTSYQTWLNLKDQPRPKEHEYILLLGGGCAFEFLTMMKMMKSRIFTLTIIDKHADDWKIFLPLIKKIAKKEGVLLSVRYVEGSNNFIENIRKFDPQLIVASNILNEIEWDELSELSLAFEELPFYLQDLYPAKMEVLLQKEAQATVIESFPQIDVPEQLKSLNLFSNFERKMYYQNKNFF